MKPNPLQNSHFPAHLAKSPGVTKREAFALSIFVALAGNGIYSEGEAVRYADLLLARLKETEPATP